jgi:uncharacterized protein (TIGR02594 family)
MPKTTALDDPSWLKIARSYLGQKEVKGPHHNPHVLRWWSETGAPFKDDETPWCGAFVGGVMVEDGRKPQAGGASAVSWNRYGTKLDKPAVGAIIVFWRKSPSSGLGHVGFIVGKDKDGNLMVLGGNQGDAVSIMPKGTERVLGYRWPGIYPYAERFNLPLLKANGTISQSEA